MTDFKKPRSIPIQELLEDIIHAILSELHVALPGAVQEYDAAKIMMQVTPMIKRVFIGENDEEVPKDYPKLVDVPVVFPRGGGAFLSLPLAAGDPVVLVAAQRSLDNWKDTDGKTPLDPGDSRRHHVTDMIAFPGPSTRDNKIPNASATDLVLGLENGDCEVHIAPDGTTWIKLAAGKTFSIGSATAGYFAARADLVDTRIGNLESALSGHTHVSSTFGGPTTPPTNAPYTGSSTASKRCKIDG